MSSPAQARREEDVRRAYHIQIEAGLRLAARTTAVGVGLSIIAHYTWPAFRRMTLPFKAWLVIGCGIFGLTIGSERALLDYESLRRVEENHARRQARLDLSRRGIIPTESEIAKWRSAKESESESSS
ncbi:hypothetical protein BDZ89DRAFT_1078792 [Hymenopellis radicata]|nr:hypothetical protein BDZ89DRAFT_1078792 [Hymenopellis radicata]